MPIATPQSIDTKHRHIHTLGAERNSRKIFTQQPLSLTIFPGAIARAWAYKKKVHAQRGRFAIGNVIRIVPYYVVAVYNTVCVVRHRSFPTCARRVVSPRDRRRRYLRLSRCVSMCVCVWVYVAVEGTHTRAKYSLCRGEKTRDSFRKSVGPRVRGIIYIYKYTYIPVSIIGGEFFRGGSSEDMFGEDRNISNCWRWSDGIIVCSTRAACDMCRYFDGVCV